jgi:hypothetical protein
MTSQKGRVTLLSGNAFNLWPYLTHNLKQHAQYVTLQKYFSNPSFSYLLFSNPTRQTKTGTVVLATQFSENRIFCHKFPVFETQKNWFFGMVSPHLCLLATVFRVS